MNSAQATQTSPKKFRKVLVTSQKQSKEPREGGRPQTGGSRAQGQPLLKARSLSQNNSRIKPVKRAGVKAQW